MKKYQLTEKLSTEAQSPAFLVGAVMRSANLLRENTEIRDQAHEMLAEGSFDYEPTKEEVIDFLKTLGWIGKCIDISFDGMQNVWRWNCDIARP